MILIKDNIPRSSRPGRTTCKTALGTNLLLSPFAGGSWPYFRSESGCGNLAPKLRRFTQVGWRRGAHDSPLNTCNDVFAAGISY